MIQEEKPSEPTVENSPKIEGTPSHNPNHSAEDVMAAFFYMYSPRFRMFLGKLSNKALRRLINTLIQYPLDKDHYYSNNLKSPDFLIEKEAFLIGNRLLESKYAMIMSTLASSTSFQKELETKLEEAAKSEPVTEERTENVEVQS